MKLRAGRLSISPTDLSQFLSCRHRTALELAVAHGVRQRPVWNDPMLEALFALGAAHERDYVRRLQAASRTLVDLSEEKDPEDTVSATLTAMRAGTDVIVQAGLSRGCWYGRPDVLLRVDRPSPALGSWSYEPADTKLARETRGGTMLQLGLYCRMLETAQGSAPARFHVVTPGDEAVAADADSGPGHQITRSYRYHDYAAYVRLLEARLEAESSRGHEDLAAANYPEPVDHCEVCPWIVQCDERRRRDDHLSLVAGISRLQRRELTAQAVSTVTALAALGDPFPFAPGRGALETYQRVRDQARVQVRSRLERRVVYELIAPPSAAPSGKADARKTTNGSEFGLARLPAPSAGDVFLDLEGDPLAGQSGREYLFGLVTVAEAGGVRYDSWWADAPHAERLAFEAVVDLIMARLREFPDMHVYHYAPYEPSAMKRLMGRYATREREIDQLLRGRRFVDLYAVVRQGIRAGVERYSIKNIEPLYEFTRDVDLRDANRALRIMEQALELGRLDMATGQVRGVVEGYNRDDCVSTLRLRDWLEARRGDLAATGHAIARPPLEVGEASEELDDRAKAVEALRARLLAGVPDDAAERSPDQQARYQLAYLLDWHRREDKAGWWEYFRLRELPEEDLFEEAKAVAGLTFVAEVSKVQKSAVLRYSYPPQEMDIRLGDKLKTQDGGVYASEIIAIDRDARWIDMKVGPKRKDLRPTALFAHRHISSEVVEDALLALGERAADAGGVGALPPCAERALLLRVAPALRSGAFAPPRHEPGPAVTDYAVRIAAEIDRSALAIQGPPGSGKTYTGARMIRALVGAGLKVGVTATSHKVIRHVLDAVAKEAARDAESDGRSGQRAPVRLGHKCGKDEDESDRVVGGGVATFDENTEACAALQSGNVNVLGGTAWLWARPEFERSVDVLFVDEAGQMSLANVLGVARSASGLVLLGDPRQLEQPSKGSHPDGVGMSALQHVLGDAETMPPERGLFLPVTWRLAPSICEFTSELFYAGKLQSKVGLERQALAGTGSLGLDGSGLWLAEIDHTGNRNASNEEAEAVARLVRQLLTSGVRWVDGAGGEHPLTADDICIVAPFNAHVQRLREAVGVAGSGTDGGGRVAASVRIGTVDKFQGQEAPVVIYSMATSHPDDAPKGMEFLYSLNRLNVATSRARCAAILVASPRLFEPDCRTPRQMHLANALCRFRELARNVGTTTGGRLA